ncbi:uncharacterized protein UV8b_03755 [Ustilaginoidea virens]|uniref:Duf1770 domain containing protein n=1 Tax=Ustilaginoidea virens TaxID=1159556 RepID=A0A8E5HQX7_USTVR|nr:uncharacterized protein UV8b_03755 [Ustilaginoidea virens]QUC19514.1 hypothetical protein UV8b_03755 [Ustilaginoidea virens]
MDPESVVTEVAETIQIGHIRSHPDLNYHAAPSTAADRKEQIIFHSPRLSDDDLLDDMADDGGDLPYSVLRPAPKTHNLPPLPDLRFEQSYLRSIENADTWWKILLITARDQIMMPFAQGLIYNLLLCGWQHWNRNAKLHGNTAGSRVRRWWYGVNNWKIPNRQT